MNSTMKRFLYKIGLGCVAMLWVLLATSCQKDVSYQTSVVVKAWAQESSGGEQHRLDNVVVYGFAADTTLYEVTNYDEALAGVMRRKSDPSQTMEAQLKGSEATLEGHGPVQVMPAHEYRSLVLLVVDTENRLFGYTQLAMVENLPYMYISVQFQPWKESAYYKNGQWWMYNSYYVPNLSCTVRPKVQYVEDGEVTNLKSSRLFAYRLEEPEMWLPKDWADAEVGRLTHTTEGRVADPIYSFASDNQGALTAKLQPEEYLVMVVNSAERCYALRLLTEEEIRAEAESTAEVRGFSVTFPLWDLQPPHKTEDGWSCYYTPEISATLTAKMADGDPLQQELREVILYAWPLSEVASCRPSSLADALEGLLTHPESGEQFEASERFSSGEESSLLFTLPLDEYLLMVVNKTCSSYALRTFDRALAHAELLVEFSTQIDPSPSTDASGWEIYYLPNLAGELVTRIERTEPASDEEGMGEAEILKGSVLHAFQVEEPSLWFPRNLADANEGRLQNSLTGEFATALYTVKAGSNGTIKPDIPHGEYLLMVSNYDNGCYALKSQAASIQPMAEEICFPIWQPEFPLVDEAGWQLFYTPNVRASIEVTVQFAEAQEPVKLDRTLLHIYPQPTGEGWAPTDYAAAVEGRLRNRETGEELLPEQSYEAERDESLLEINLLRGDYLLLVVGHYNCYALHTLSASDTGIQIPLNFQLWRTERPYIDEMGWSVYSYYEMPAENE